MSDRARVILLLRRMLVASAMLPCLDKALSVGKCTFLALMTQTSIRTSARVEQHYQYISCYQPRNVSREDNRCESIGLCIHYYGIILCGDLFTCVPA